MNYMVFSVFKLYMIFSQFCCFNITIFLFVTQKDQLFHFNLEKFEMFRPYWTSLFFSKYFENQASKIKQANQHSNIQVSI